MSPSSRTSRRLFQVLLAAMWLAPPAAAQVLTLNADTWRQHVEGKSVLIKFDEPFVSCEHSISRLLHPSIRVSISAVLPQCASSDTHLSPLPYPCSCSVTNARPWNPPGHNSPATGRITLPVSSHVSTVATKLRCSCVKTMVS
jgi:hypothetical protein